MNEQLPSQWEGGFHWNWQLLNIKYTQGHPESLFGVWCVRMVEENKDLLTLPTYTFPSHSGNAGMAPLCHSVERQEDIFNSTVAFQPIQWQIRVNNINSLAIPWHLFQCKCIFFSSRKPNSNLSRDKSFFLGSGVCKIPIFKALNLLPLTGVRKH